MTHAPVLLQDLFYISIFAFAIIFLFQKLRLPAIVGFLIVGALVGPYGLGIITGVQQVKNLEEIGVILLLFVIGLELSIRDMIRIKKAIFGAGTLQIIATVFAAVGVAFLAGQNLQTGLLWGFLIALSSTAIVLRSLQENDALNTPAGRLSLAVLIMQDLAIAVMLGMLPFLSGDPSHSGMLLALSLAKMAGIIIGTLLIGWYILPWFFHMVVHTRSRELFLIAVLFIVLTMLWTYYYAGLTLAFGAFMAGLILSESEYSHQAMAEIVPFRDIFAGLFFISVGMMLDIHYVWNHSALVLSFVLLLIASKFILASFSIYLVGYPLPVALMAGLSLSQIGEFSFILLKEGQNLGLIDAGILQMFLAPAVISMILAPFMVRGMPYVGKLASFIPFCRMPPYGMQDQERIYAQKLNDHVIIAGYGLNGQNVARVLKDASISYIAVEMNPETVRQKRAEGESITFGDVTYPEVLRHLRVDKARVLVITVSDPAAARRTVSIARTLNPYLTIIVRTRYVAEVNDLFAIGATDVIPEEFETGIEIFSRVLEAFRIPVNTIDRYADEIRKEGYERFRKSDILPFHKDRFDASLQSINLIAYRIEKESDVLRMSLGELDLQTAMRIIIIAVAREGNVYNIPGPNFILKKNDIITLAGNEKNLQRALDFLEGNPPG